jgi:hypothetical protein
MKSVVTALLACSMFTLSSCVSGIIYTHTTNPLSTNFKDTPFVDRAPAKGDVKEVDYYIRVSWNANGIGEIAEANGFEKVYYADIESLRILGIWTQEWVHVYGSKKAP